MTIPNDPSDPNHILQSNLVDPSGLEIDAVVPQCLDNQYISDLTYERMMEGRVDFRNEAIQEMRIRAFRTEFIRSLVYSSQVIIQRAFFRNSDFLYTNYQPSDPKNLNAFAGLVRSRAIVPFLYRETSVLDNLEFDVQTEGDRATKALMAELEESVTCVRLGKRDADNDRATAAMATAFGTGIARLRFMTPAQRNAMAAEIFADPSQLQKEGSWEQFNLAIDNLADYAYRTAGELAGKGKTLSRQRVYEDRFVVERGPVSVGAPDDRVRLGQLRPSTAESPFCFELKKYVDLIYNVNLPDYLKRFTFTPAGMPTRMAMQDAAGDGYNHDHVSALISNDDALESIRRTFMAHTQGAMSLPLLSELTVADVVQIRALPEWTEFKDAQSAILRDPLNVLNRLPDFQRAFDAFQRALSRWYNVTYKRRETEQRYCSYISLALSIAGKLIVAGSEIDAVGKAATTFAIDGAVTAIPRKAKGYAAKLMVGVYDLGQRRLDSDRTYSIELMQTDEELLREDIIELLNSVRRARDESVPGAPGALADQGIR